jgi:hypothetical protein
VSAGSAQESPFSGDRHAVTGYDTARQVRDDLTWLSEHGDLDTIAATLRLRREKLEKDQAFDPANYRPPHVSVRHSVGNTVIEMAFGIGDGAGMLANTYMSWIMSGDAHKALCEWHGRHRHG